MHQSKCIYLFIKSFSRRFYPKRLTNEDNRINQFSATLKQLKTDPKLKAKTLYIYFIILHLKNKLILLKWQMHTTKIIN